MSESRNHTIRQPLRFEDRPVMFTIWRTWRNFWGAVEAHKKPVKFGPNPLFFLRWKQISDTYKAGKSRFNSRFRALTWSVYPYRQGDIKPDYS